MYNEECEISRKKSQQGSRDIGQNIEPKTLGAPHPLGSVGKTSVKEMIAVICKSAGPTHASIKSYNNHWGVPLTMASMPANAKYTILEMGMNHAGELDHLSKMVCPDIAVITKVAPAHLAHFASVDDIAKAKAQVRAEKPTPPFCAALAHSWGQRGPHF